MSAEILRSADRIVVLGPPGSGKSTLARRLGPRLGLPVVHLDQHFWRPGWIQTPRDEWRDHHAELIAQPRWIIDGSYRNTVGDRLARAEAAILLDLPRPIYLWRALWRIAASYGRVRADLAPGCPEHFDVGFLRFVVGYHRTDWPVVTAAVERSRCSVIHLTTPGEVAALLRAMEGPSG